jgi:hypothetical protein
VVVGFVVEVRVNVAVGIVSIVAVGMDVVDAAPPPPEQPDG